MAVDELTDKAFFDLYQKNPNVKKIVDDTQKKYHAHFSQKGMPGYNEANVPVAMREAKEAVQRLLGQQKPALGPLESLFEGIGNIFSKPYLGLPATAASIAMLLYL